MSGPDDRREPVGEGEGAVRRAYRGLASRYDARWSRYVAESTRETLARVELPSAGRLLDVGCGTGVLLAEVARRAPRLEAVGLDLSPAMLSLARERVPTWVRLAAGSAHRLPLASGSIDVVVSVSALHFWRRPDAAIREMRRALRPDGRLVLTDWCRDPVVMKLRDLRLRITDPAHHRTLSEAELARLLKKAGFEVVRLERYRIPGLWGMMTAVAAPG